MSNPFRVLIAGGSVSGLALAIALEKAGIDFLVLESGPVIAPQLGASLGLHPHGVNILDQLGAWDSIAPIVSPLHEGKHHDSAGKCFLTSELHKSVHTSLGYPIAFLERKQVLQSLYDAIGDKSKVLTQKAIVSYTESDDKITALAEDGAVYEGDLLVGADGVHSTVRRLMSHRIAKEKGESIDEKSDRLAERAFRSDYKTVFGISRRSDTVCAMPDGCVYNGYDQGSSTVIASGVPGYTYWFLFVKNKEQTYPPNVPRYTDADCEKLIEEFRAHKMSNTICVGDAWDARVKAVLVSLEEGIVDTWSHGRVVLVGDAIHKVTVNAGLGGNMAWEGLVHLTNLLKALVVESGSAGTISSASLSTVFAEYRARHLPRVQTIVGVSASLTRLEAQDTTMDRIMSRYIVPLLPDGLKGWVYGKFSRGAPVFDFLPVKKEMAINSFRQTSEKA